MAGLMPNAFTVTFHTPCEVHTSVGATATRAISRLTGTRRTTRAIT